MYQKSRTDIIHLLTKWELKSLIKLPTSLINEPCMQIPLRNSFARIVLSFLWNASYNQETWLGLELEEFCVISSPGFYEGWCNDRYIVWLNAKNVTWKKKIEEMRATKSIRKARQSFRKKYNKVSSIPWFYLSTWRTVKKYRNTRSSVESTSGNGKKNKCSHQWISRDGNDQRWM